MRRLAANRQAVTITRLRPGVAYRVAVQACTRAGRYSKAATDTATTARARTAPAPSSPHPEPGTVIAPAPTAPTGAPTAPTPPTAPTGTVDLTGTVTVTTGNCMPTIGPRNDPINPCRTSPAANTRVLLYAPVLKHHTDLPGSFYPGPRPPTA